MIIVLGGHSESWVYWLIIFDCILPETMLMRLIFSHVINVGEFTSLMQSTDSIQTSFTEKLHFRAVLRTLPL